MPTWHVAQVGAAAAGLADCALTGSSVKNAQATHNSAARAALPISRPLLPCHVEAQLALTGCFLSVSGAGVQGGQA